MKRLEEIQSFDQVEAILKRRHIPDNSNLLFVVDIDGTWLTSFMDVSLLQGADLQSRYVAAYLDGKDMRDSQALFRKYITPSFPAFFQRHHSQITFVSTRSVEHIVRSLRNAAPVLGGVELVQRFCESKDRLQSQNPKTRGPWVRTLVTGQRTVVWLDDEADNFALLSGADEGRVVPVWVQNGPAFWCDFKAGSDPRGGVKPLVPHPDWPEEQEAVRLRISRKHQDSKEWARLGAWVLPAQDPLWTEAYFPAGWTLNEATGEYRDSNGRVRARVPML